MTPADWQTAKLFGSNIHEDFDVEELGFAEAAVAYLRGLTGEQRIALYAALRSALKEFPDEKSFRARFFSIISEWGFDDIRAKVVNLLEWAATPEASRELAANGPVRLVESIKVDLRRWHGDS